jgi:simple sugar transport system substrate-binding protein
MKKILFGVFLGSLLVAVSMGAFFAVDVAAVEPPCGRPLKVAIILPASRTDQSWNQQGATSLESLKDKWSLITEVAENSGYGDIKPLIRDLANKGFDLVIGHANGYNTAGPEVAVEKGIRVTTMDSKTAVKANPGLVANINNRGQGGAYLAGVAAGKMTRTGVVGIVLSGEIPGWNHQSAGFMEGLHSVKPDAKLLYNLIGDAAYEDAAGAKRNVETQIAAGADVVFGQGDGASFGMIAACSENKAKDGGKVWFIDVIGDKRSADTAGVLLTSVLWDFSGLYEEMFISMYSGTFGKEHYRTLANNGARLMDFHPEVPESVRNAVEKARQDIIAGKTKVSYVTDAGELRELRAKLFPK